MAIAFRSVGVSPGAATDECIIVKPAGLTVDDLMIAHVVSRENTSTPTATSPPVGGWTEIRQDAGTRIRSALFWKIAVSGDVSATDFTFDVDASGEAPANIGAITAWTGHDPTTPINANNGQWNAASVTVTSPAITQSVSNCVILMICGISDDNTQSGYAISTDNPASWAEAYDINYNGLGDGAVAMGYADRPETTSTGNGTATSSGSDENIGQLVAIAPFAAVDITISPPLVNINTAVPAPGFSGGITASPPVVNLDVAVFVPTIILPFVTIFPPVVNIAIAVPLPTFSGGVTFTAPLVNIDIGVYVPTIDIGITISSPLVDIAIAVFAPEIVIPYPAFPTLKVRIAFDTDPMADTPIWAEISADVLSLYTKRGRQHELNRIETGIAIIQLLNVDGNYWPLNAGGAYYPKVLPGKKINIRASFEGIMYDLYTGFIESWEPGWTKGQIAGVTVRCTDIGKRFTRFDLNNAGEAQELSGTRVGNVLDEIGWPAADRDLDAGQTTLKATGAQVAVNAMTHLFLVQDTEVGIIFLALDGDLQFQDRHARLKSPYTVSQATFGDDPGELGYRMLKPSYDDQYIFNDIRRTRDGGTEQTASDATSQDDYGKSTSNKTGLLMLQDAEAQDQCSYMLSQYKDPTFRMKAMELYPEIDPSNLFPKVLGYDISTRITVRNNEASLDKDYYIEGIIHNFSPGSDTPWVTRWNLSDASNVVYWALGVAGFSELGETTRLAY